LGRSNLGKEGKDSEREEILWQVIATPTQRLLREKALCTKSYLSKETLERRTTPPP